jgi:hypothetical protein
MIHPLIAPHIPAIQALCQEFGVVRLEEFDLPPDDEPALLVTFEISQCIKCSACCVAIR